MKLSECSVGRVVLIQKAGLPKEIGHIKGFYRLDSNAPVESTKVVVSTPDGNSPILVASDLEVYDG